MSTYGPQGRATLLLDRLDAGDASYAVLLDTLLAADPALPRKRLWHIIGSLLADELIGGVRQNYYILPQGREALAVLRAGKDFTVARSRPSVRVFA